MYIKKTANYKSQKKLYDRVNTVRTKKGLNLPEACNKCKVTVCQYKHFQRVVKATENYTDGGNIANITNGDNISDITEKPIQTGGNDNSIYDTNIKPITNSNDVDEYTELRQEVKANHKLYMDNILAELRQC